LIKHNGDSRKFHNLLPRRIARAFLLLVLLWDLIGLPYAHYPDYRDCELCDPWFKDTLKHGWLLFVCPLCTLGYYGYEGRRVWLEVQEAKSEGGHVIVCFPPVRGCSSGFKRPRLCCPDQSSQAMENNDCTESEISSFTGESNGTTKDAASKGTSGRRTACSISDSNRRKMETDCSEFCCYNLIAGLGRWCAIFLWVGTAVLTLIPGYWESDDKAESVVSGSTNTTTDGESPWYIFYYVHIIPIGVGFIIFAFDVCSSAKRNELNEQHPLQRIYLLRKEGPSSDVNSNTSQRITHSSPGGGKEFRQSVGRLTWMLQWSLLPVLGILMAPLYWLHCNYNIFGSAEAHMHVVHWVIQVYCASVFRFVCACLRDQL